MEVEPTIHPDLGNPAPQVKDEPMQDLFGDDEDIEVKDVEVHPDGGDAAEDALSDREREHRRAMEYAEEDNDVDQDLAVRQIREAQVSIPVLPRPRPSDGKLWTLRLPNFVHLESKPFQPENYVELKAKLAQRKTDGESSERSMLIKLEVENTIRWRWGKDPVTGQQRRESNSRVIKWSDGTMSFLLGKELLDITTTNTQDATVGPAPTPAPAPVNYLVAQHLTAAVLQTEAPIAGTLNLRPTGMQSSTHRLLSRAVGQKHNRVAKLKMADIDTQAQNVANFMTPPAKQRKPRAPNAGGRGGRRDHFTSRRTKSTSRRSGGYDYSDDEPMGGYSDEDMDDDSRPRSSRADTRKGTGEYQTDDFVVSDEEDENEDSDEEDGAPRHKRPKREEAEDEPDSLDEMEAKMEADTRRSNKRKAPTPTPKPDPDEPAPISASPEKEGEVESEDMEDEDEGPVVVRRSRRRAAIEDEDEDE